ncbi:tail fiber assembly protein [Symbiopectobacterium sp.]|uniref:tail fiber assembly protein n=1 Tax=Symbiopectobacterium sp. TaxID=2952789 RepID=UPI003F305E8B
MQLKNIKNYYPDNISYDHRFQYFRSEDGQDFYESFPLFTKKYKLCINPDTGIICSISKEIYSLYPAGFTIVEVDELPDGVDISGGWLFDGQKVVRRIPTHGERVAKAKLEKATLMQKASAAIAPLQDAVDLDMTTEAERAQFIAWKKYRVLLNRVDISTAPDIAWPEAPEGEKMGN